MTVMGPNIFLLKPNHGKKTTLDKAYNKHVSSIVKNIDEDKFFQVMLAKVFKDYKDKIDWSIGVGVQIKYNGGRIVATKDGGIF